jgi:hypothetical protein
VGKPAASSGLSTRIPAPIPSNKKDASKKECNNNNPADDCMQDHHDDDDMFISTIENCDNNEVHRGTTEKNGTHFVEDMFGPTTSAGGTTDSLWQPFEIKTKPRCERYALTTRAGQTQLSVAETLEKPRKAGTALNISKQQNTNVPGT